jgi:hypothetical protein
MPLDEAAGQKRKEAASSLLRDMEATAARMRALIVAMPPHDLLGYIYAQRLMADQLKDSKVSMVIWDGMSHDVDRSFEGEDWESGPFPTQGFPQEVLKLLGALDARRASGWLAAESYIRNLGEEGRNDLAYMLAELRKSLCQHPARYFLYGSDTPFFIWLQRADDEIDWRKVRDKASAAALLTPPADMTGIMIEASAGGTYKTAYTFEITRPSSRTDDNAYIYDDAERMKKRARKSDR